MAGTNAAKTPAQPAPAGGWGSLWGNQDVQTVKDLRFGVGVIGTLLPIALIVGNRALGSTVIIPASMSGSYYTGTRNLFVGSLCALGVFLIFYRHTVLQDLCTSFAGVCAVIVAFAPTAPAPPKTEPAWINYLHLSAAGALLFTLGVFCLVVFRQSEHGSLYLICGVLVLVSVGVGAYTAIRPTSWSTGWPSLYMFEAIAVFSFGIAWIAAALEDNATVDQQGRGPASA